MASEQNKHGQKISKKKIPVRKYSWQRGKNIPGSARAHGLDEGVVSDGV
jgi:Ni/Co efflux regulator RcnB